MSVSVYIDDTRARGSDEVVARAYELGIILPQTLPRLR